MAYNLLTAYKNNGAKINVEYYMFGFSLGQPDREQIYEAHDAVNYLIIVFPLCDMNLLEYKERGLMTEDKVMDQLNR